MPDKDISFKDFIKQNGASHGKRYKRDDLFEFIETGTSKPIKEIKKAKHITYTTKKRFDFLKFYGIVEYYAVKVIFEDKITFKELKLLFFLYTEPPFTRADWIDYMELTGWNKNRMTKWIKLGILKKYETKAIKTAKRKLGRKPILYTLSEKTRRNISSIYDKLLLRYKISEYNTHNPLFRERTRSYQDKRYAKKIKQMNAGKYNTEKEDDDWDDLNNLSFMEFVENYNKDNHETLTDYKESKRIYQEKIKPKKDVE